MVVFNVILNEFIFQRNLIKPVEFEILDRWFNWMIKSHDCNLDLIFYLRTKPETCIKRLASRGRSEEVDRISLDYLQSLHHLHELWLNSADYAENGGEIAAMGLYKPRNIIIIDADQSIDQVYKTIELETRNAVIMAN